MQKFPPGLCHSETEFEKCSSLITYVFGAECYSSHHQILWLNTQLSLMSKKTQIFLVILSQNGWKTAERSHFCFNEIPWGFFHGIILCSAKRSRIPPKRMTDFVYCGWLLEVCTDWYVHTFCLAAINTKYHTMTTYYWVMYLYITLYTDPKKGVLILSPL